MAQLPQRLPGEHSKNYNYFIEFVLLGPDRSYSMLARKIGKTCNNYQQIAQKWDWQGRAAAYDASLRKQDLELMDQARAESIQKRALWEIQRQSDANQIVNKLGQRINELLAVDLTKLEDEAQPDGTTKKVRTAKKCASILISLSMAVKAYRDLSADMVRDLSREEKETADAGLNGKTVAGRFQLFSDEPEEQPLEVAQPPDEKAKAVVQ